MIRYLVSLLLILAACAKTPADPTENWHINQSVNASRVVIPGEWIEIMPEGEEIYQAQFEKSLLYIENISNKKYAVFGISAADNSAMVLNDGIGIKAKITAEGGGWADMGLEYRVAGKRVVGPRLAAIADATSPEDMVLKFNLLLSRLREHGLIER